VILQYSLPGSLYLRGVFETGSVNVSKTSKNSTQKQPAKTNLVNPLVSHLRNIYNIREAKQITEGVNRMPRHQYPWNEWADGQERVATYGKDFECGIPSFVTLVHHHARRLGKVATTSVDGLDVQFQIKTPESPMNNSSTNHN
jgi:hypothetical protein